MRTPDASSLFSERTRENIFAPYRERVLYPVATMAVLVLLPLGVHHMMRGRVEPGGLLLLLVTMLAADVIAIARGKRPPIPFALLLLPGAASVLLSLASHTMYGAMWSYPMAMFSYFVLPRRLANATSACFLGMAVSLMSLQEDGGTVLRFALSLAFCLITVNIILNVLDAMHGRLLEQSLVDPLTGAFNRRQMDVALAQALERHRRTRADASVLIIDVDHFKAVNDGFGHAVGDQVLRDLVAVVRQRSRQLDQVFRMGGEEFLVLLPDTREADARTVAEFLRASIASRCRAGPRTVTVSIGVAGVRQDDDVQAWMRRADDALYRAKAAGRNRVVYS